MHWSTRKVRIDHRSENDHHTPKSRAGKQFEIFLALGNACVIGFVVNDWLTGKKLGQELVELKKKVSESSSNAQGEENITPLEKSVTSLLLWND